jgi:hypothetical protein
MNLLDNAVNDQVSSPEQVDALTLQPFTIVFVVSSPSRNEHRPSRTKTVKDGFTINIT